MKLEIATWKIRGVRPLMQGNYREMMSVETETPATSRGTRTKPRLKPFDEAKKQLYNGEDGFWHPALSFWKGVMENCTGYKIDGTAASSVLPKLLFPLEDEKFLLYDPETLDAKSPKKLTAKEWQMDSRRVVNEKRGALIVHRPKWPKWGGFLSMEVDLEMFPGREGVLLDVVTVVLNIAGRFGIGTGRLMLNPKTKKWGGLSLGKFTAERR